MRALRKNLMTGACVIACRYPELSLEDAVGDAQQLAERLRFCNIEDSQEEEAVFTAACWFIGAERELTPQSAIEKALRLRDVVGA